MPDAKRAGVTTLWVRSMGPLSSEYGDGMRGRARAPEDAERRGGEEELVPPLLRADLGEALGIGVVDQREAQERDRQVRAHAEAGIAAGPLVHHVPGDGRDVILAEPLQARNVEDGVRVHAEP